MLSTGCPGIILYGRRRMGKSTLLRNLDGFLPDKVKIVSFSMQKPELFHTLSNWMNSITEQIEKTLYLEKSSTEPCNQLTDFSKKLNGYNTYLEKNDQRLLLAIDEYENMDQKIGEGVFNEDLLKTIRESIQFHRRITWLLSGSHEITELTCAPWTSYMVSSRTIEVPMFSIDETRLLLTEPMKHSSLWQKDPEKRPCFPSDFWGDNGIEQIHKQTGGWPHLVQLLAETLVDLVNDEGLSRVDESIWNKAVDKAVLRGDTVFYELLRRESTLVGEWDYILAFQSREMQSPPCDKSIYRSLRRRMLIEEQDGQWHLRVPLMRHWLIKRG